MIRIHQPDPQPEPIREILARLFVARGLARRQGRLQLERAWEKAVGKEGAMRDHTRIVGLKRGIFEVEVNSPVVMQELASFHKRRIIKVLQESLPGQTVKEVKFRAGSWGGE